MSKALRADPQSLSLVNDGPDSVFYCISKRRCFTVIERIGGLADDEIDKCLFAWSAERYRSHKLRIDQ